MLVQGIIPLKKTEIVSTGEGIEAQDTYVDVKDDEARAQFPTPSTSGVRIKPSRLLSFTMLHYKYI